MVESEEFGIFLEDFVDMLNGLEASIVKMKRQIAKLVGVNEKPKAGISEEATFGVLKWVDEKGQRLGDYQVAYKNQNNAENWQHAFNILKTNNATIANSFHEEGYQYRYWIYSSKYDDRIFRKKLNKEEVKG